MWGLQKGIREDFFSRRQIDLKVRRGIHGEKSERKLLRAIDALLLNLIETVRIKDYSVLKEFLSGCCLFFLLAK